MVGQRTVVDNSLAGKLARLAGGIFGTPVQATFWTRALIVFGMVLGVTGVAALFAVAWFAALRSW